MFFFLRNKTGADVTAFFGFSSDDSGCLFVNGDPIAEVIGGRGYGPPGVIQTLGASAVTLHAGLNLVQLSYTEGCGGSGGRVGVFKDACYSTTFSAAEVEGTVDP